MIKVIIKDGYNKVILNENEEIEISDIIENVNIEEETFKYLEGIEAQRVCGNAINELYNYKGIELYTFYRATIFMNLKEVFTKVLILKTIIEKYGENLEVITDSNITIDVAKNLFALDVKIEEKENTTSDTVNNRGILIKRVLKGISYFVKFKLKKNKNKTLVFTQAASINKISIESNEGCYDSLYGNILNDIKNNQDIFNVQFLNNIDSYSKSNLLCNEYFAFEIIPIIKKLIGEKILDKASIDDKLDNLSKFNYNYHGYDLKEAIDKYVFNNLKEHYISYAKEICLWEKLIEKLKINRVLVVDEADRPRCIVTAGNVLGIETYALQHGIINQTSAAYLTPTKNEKLIPKKTFVWGEKFKEFLVSSTKVYNEKNIVVIGQPRTDYLYKKLKEQSSDNSKEETKILFATQPIRDLAEESLEMLLESLIGIKNYKLIIKLHPADTFENLYTDMIKKYNIKNVEITKSLDIYDGLLWCDVVISVHSTVVLEGAMFNKPSICIILPKYNDEGNFVKEGLSLGVKNSNELKSILINKEYLNNCNYKKFVEKSFYKVDGLVSKRASSYIKSSEETL